ncbi:MAG TPA: M15 family metallopeptidase [Bacilli bacterium]|nr:M15 family metallopeptidase [Bacilli bacterium]
MRKLKLKNKIKKYLILGLIGIIILTGGIIWIKVAIYHHSDTYKLLEVGYEKKEITLFKEKLNDEQIEMLITKDYDYNVYKILNEKYFISKNYERYLEYSKANPTTSLEDVIAIVNVNADHDWYNEDCIKSTDTSKGILMLVNKFNKLDSNYVPSNLESVSLTYAYDDNELAEITINAYIEMAKAAKTEGLTLIAASSYRSYEDQETLYNRYVYNYGIEDADSKSARPGHSEHQTGLAIDILTYNTTTTNFSSTPESIWLEENSYKYGFILRYPENKTYLTGYAYEAWHYRYVGIEAATVIHDEDITFDEYYAYYIAK